MYRRRHIYVYVAILHQICFVDMVTVQKKKSWGTQAFFSSTQDFCFWNLTFFWSPRFFFLDQRILFRTLYFLFLDPRFVFFWTRNVFFELYFCFGALEYLFGPTDCFFVLFFFGTQAFFVLDPRCFFFLLDPRCFLEL